MATVFVSTDARHACLRVVIGSAMGAYPRGTGSNPGEGNEHFFLIPWLYFRLSLTQTDTHTHPREHTLSLSLALTHFPLSLKLFLSLSLLCSTQRKSQIASTKGEEGGGGGGGTGREVGQEKKRNESAVKGAWRK